MLSVHTLCSLFSLSVLSVHFAMLSSGCLSFWSPLAALCSDYLLRLSVLSVHLSVHLSVLSVHLSVLSVHYQPMQPNTDPAHALSLLRARLRKENEECVIWCMRMLRYECYGPVEVIRPTFISLVTHVTPPPPTQALSPNIFLQ